MDIKIYEIKGKLVMLDSDLAKIYECKNGTKEINQAVRNNKEKFSDDVSWILSDDENNNLRSKFLTSSLNFLPHLKSNSTFLETFLNYFLQPDLFP